MDYRRFLGRTTLEVLPYFGGSRVVSGERRLRVKGSVTAGWWSFQIDGRFASARERAEAPDLSRLPRQLGHWAQGWLFSPAREPRRLFLQPASQPELCTPVSGRSWHDGSLLFDACEFESEVEESVRLALEQRRSLTGIRGVGSGLRMAFAYALTLGIAERRGLVVSPHEIVTQSLVIADQGEAAATRYLEQVQERRDAERERLQGRQPRSRSSGRVRARLEVEAFGERVGRALDAAGAELLRCRAVDEGLLEVSFRFLDERFISLVDQQTLRVFDAGICLSGEDRQLNLESLPSVIREAVNNGELFITRHF